MYAHECKVAKHTKTERRGESAPKLQHECRAPPLHDEFASEKEKKRKETEIFVVERMQCTRSPT
jgi:hypothetical protein